MKRRSIFGLAGLVILLAAAFLLVSFRLISSRTATNSTVAASRGGDTGPSWNFSPETTGLYVGAEERMAQALRERVKRLLQSQEHMGKFTSLNAPADQMDIPQLYVQVKPVTHVWTPVYAHSEYELVIAYASNGDIPFRDDATPHFVYMDDQPVLQFQGKISLTDNSWGLMSLPGYRDYLADQLAGQVQKTLQQQFNP
jgi:hypothetical protein